MFAPSTPILTYDQLQQELIRTFGAPARTHALSHQVENLRSAFSSPAEVRGLAILDIGCGCDSGSAESEGNGGTWAPWLCRAVSLLGGKAVGVDVGYCSPADRARFEFHRMDLSRPEELDAFATGSFDAVNCTNFLSSPHLVYRCEFFERSQRLELGERIQQQINRLLKQGGRVIEFDRDVDNF